MATTDRIDLPGERVEALDRLGQTVVLGGAAFAATFTVLPVAVVSFVGASEARVTFDMDASAVLIMQASVILADFNFDATASLVAAGQSTASVRLVGAATGALSWSPYLGFDMRNTIINGNFDVWQRGTSLIAGTGTRYIADHWRTSSVGSTIAASRQDFTLGQTDVPYEPRHFHRCVIASSAGATNGANLSQPLEGVRTFAGQDAVLTFWAKADASKNIAVEFTQYFGTGGGASAEVTVEVNTIALTTSWQKFTIPVTFPSLSGKTIGTDNKDCAIIFFWMDAGSSFNARTNTLGQQNGTFDYAQVQIEAGSIASPFEYRPFGVELAMCQRYYERATSADAETLFSFYATAGGQAQYRTAMFTVEKHAAPTMVITMSSNSNVSSVAVTGTTGRRGFLWEAISTAAGVGHCGVDFTAEAELI